MRICIHAYPAFILAASDEHSHTNGNEQMALSVIPDLIIKTHKPRSEAIPIEKESTQSDHSKCRLTSLLAVVSFACTRWDNLIPGEPDVI